MSKKVRDLASLTEELTASATIELSELELAAVGGGFLDAAEPVELNNV